MNLYESIKSNLKESSFDDLVKYTDITNKEGSEVSKEDLPALYKAWTIKENRTEDLDKNIDDFKEFLTNGVYYVDNTINNVSDYANSLLEEMGLYELFSKDNPIGDITEFLDLEKLKNDYPNITKDRIIDEINYSNLDKYDDNFDRQYLYDYINYEKLGQFLLDKSKVFNIITNGCFVEIQ